MKSKKYKLKIFCDFDGTVTKNDIWVHSLGKFINDKLKFEEIGEEYGTCRITGRECINKELSLIENFTFEKFNEYLEEEELDDYFRGFMEFCKVKDFDLTILSEGLDYYIKFILNKFKLDIKYYCNTLITSGNGNGNLNLSCDFPYGDENCNWCGMSKRNILLNYTNDFEDEISVLIGDGVSDFCVSNYADIVFAKKKLASYCWKNNITYFEFNTFEDIQKKLIKLEETHKLKHRQTAKVLRKDAFLGG